DYYNLKIHIKFCKKIPLRNLNYYLSVLLTKEKSLGVLTEKEAKYLLIKHPKTTIYYLPKIHKNKEKPPGRPIVSGINSLFARVGEYVDTFLKNIVMTNRAFLRDGGHLINILKELHNVDNCMLVTIDVESLYTNIDQNDGINAVKWALKHKSLLKRSQRKFVVELLEFAMNNNFFWYNNTFFQQCKGCCHGS
ncbi:unnamed protein product, partial [Staurois parvus]